MSVTPTPTNPCEIWCNNGKLYYGKGNNLINSTADGQGTFITPNPSTATRIYKAFPTDLEVGKTYTVSITGEGWSLILQKRSTDGTSGSNVSGWVTTYDFVPDDGYDYGIAMQYVSGGSAQSITPSDFNGTLSLKKWGVYVDGTAETLTVSGANLFNAADVVDDGKYVSSGNGNMGTPSASGGTFAHSDFFPVIGGKTYFFGQTPFRASSAGLAWYSDYNASLGSYTYSSGVNGTALGNASMKATAPDDAKWMRFSIRTDTGFDTDWQNTVYVCEVVDDTPVISQFQPYGAPQTVTGIPNKLGVGDYKDEYEFVSGVLTHRVGVKVLDGTEEWSKVTGYNVFYTAISTMKYCNPVEAGFATHFVGTAAGNANMPDGSIKFTYTTASTDYGAISIKYNDASTTTEFANFLATQYAAGTPVIVVYPLATATTEQLTPHALTSYAGTTIVDATSEVSNSYEVVYKASQEPQTQTRMMVVEETVEPVEETDEPVEGVER